MFTWRINRSERPTLLAAIGLVLMCSSVKADIVVAPGDTLRVSSPLGTQVSLGDGSSVLVQAGGSVITNVAPVIDTGGGTITVTNLGTLTSNSSQGIGAIGATLIFRNAGTINGDLPAILAETITNSTNSGVIDGWLDGVNAHTITDLDNSGTIKTHVADGIHAVDIGSLVNSGRIDGDRYGVFASTIGSLVNSGEIIGGEHQGINAFTLTSLVNSGSITGIRSGVLATNLTSLVNSGTITGETSHGVFSTTLTSLVNSGTITGETNYGVFSTTLTSLVNSGTIYGDRSGIAAGTLASLVNSGTIIGGNGTAIIEIQNADTSLTLLPGSNIQGLVDLGGGVNTLVVGNGLSMATTFTDAAPVIGATGGAPFAVSGTTVHVVDPTGLALADAMLADSTGAISDVLADRFGGDGGGAVAVAMGNGTSLTVTPVADTGRVSRAWAEVFGGWRDRDADGPAVGSDHVFGGVMAGIDTMAGDGTRVGLFAGGSQGKADVDFNAQDIETESVFGGLYASHDTGSVRIDVAVTVGLADYDSTRLVANNLVAGGIETARADYDGIFVSPEITVSTAMAMGAMTVRPSLRLRYAGLWLDGYTESGSASNLSVDGRDVHILEARAHLAIPMTLMSDERGTLSTELRVGVDGRTRIGSDNVDAVLVGQNISFDPGGGDDVVTGFAAAAFAMAFTNNLSLTGSLEAGYGSDDTAHATAKLGARVDF